MSEPSVFARIVAGELPAETIYEDERTLAFLDIHPVQPGHTLVISKVQVPQLWDLETEDYHAVMDTSQKVAKRLKEVLQVPFIGVQVVGVDVPHPHVHLIPFTTVEQYRRRPDMTLEPDFPALAAMAKRLQLSV